jgi:hypothetical protein
MAHQVHRLDLNLVFFFVRPRRVRPHGDALLTGASGAVTPPWCCRGGAGALVLSDARPGRGLALPW